MQEHSVDKQSDREQMACVVERRGQSLECVVMAKVRQVDWQGEGPLQAEGMGHSIGEGEEENKPVQVIPKEMAGSKE